MRRLFGGSCPLRGILGPLFSLDALPVGFDRGRVARRAICKYVGVPADHLLGDRFDDIAECKRALFLGEPGVIDNLKQQVSKLVLQIDQIAASDRIGNLVGFFDRIRCNRLEGLLEIPRAARHRRPERRHDLDKPRDVARRCQSVCHIRPLQLARTLDDGIRDRRGEAVRLSRQCAGDKPRIR